MMKKLSTFAISRMGIITLLSLTLIIFSISFISIEEEVRYKNVDSNISILSPSFMDGEGLTTTVFACDANFIMDDNVLSDISSFQFDIPIHQLRSTNAEVEHALHALLKSNNASKVSFTQQRVMVLPAMKMIHTIGQVKIGNVNYPIAFHLAYSINEQKEITMKGQQTIRLNGLNDEIGIKLDLKMVENLEPASETNLVPRD